MPYITTFDSIVTATKRNNRYYGPTESKKLASFLSEVKTDIQTVFEKVGDIRNSLEVLASGYFTSGQESESLQELRLSVYDLESKLKARIYIEGDQPQVI